MSEGDEESSRPRITVLGGGNGISAVLTGLSRLAASGAGLEITAIVATADDGGSSGRLRQERGGIPPGDLRNCLLALASARDGLFPRLFGHRYDGAGNLAGHSLGNLILAALAEQEGCYVRAVELAGEMLRATGRVLPVSLESVRLEAEAHDGSRISGESRIGRSHCAVQRVWLDPADAQPAPGVLEAMGTADLLVLGPGSLFTSLLAVLLVPGVAEAFRACRGRKVMVANLMTQPGETVGMDLDEHLAALDRHVGPGLVDVVLVHSAEFSPERMRPYEDQGAQPIRASLRGRRAEQVAVEEMATAGGKIRHDPDLLAPALLRLGFEVSALRDSRGRP